ncbi:hypothetical protein Tco_0821553 [Tanacetum coccineum]|uniref:Reverse transcriptase domain-containing protein n=1 Tax=Tanacetum coccineum TaxID=301880 RepID=A0ABQ5AHD7_9ASTR
MLKSLLSNKEKLLELANTPLNENCSAVILKKLPEKLGDPGKFLIPCGLVSSSARPSRSRITPYSSNPTPNLKPVEPSLSSSPIITSFEESDLIWEEFEAYLASDSFPLPGNDDPVDLLLEEFADELALITFPSGNDDLPFDIESDLSEIEYLLNHDPTKEMDFILEDSVDEGNLANPNNDLDKVFNPGILIHENLFEITIRVTPDKNVKKLSSSNASLILEDFNPPLYELPFHKEVPGFETLLSFSSKNEEKVFNPGILTSSKGVRTVSLSTEYLIGTLKLSKSLKFLKARMDDFSHALTGENI